MILALIVAATISPQCLERLQWLFQEWVRECQIVGTLFSIAGRGNITSAYLTSIHSTLLFTMSSFFLRARWVGTIRFLIMCLPLLDPGSNSQEMTILACGNFWPIAFIHAQMNPIISSSLESSFSNIWWTPGPFVSSSASTTSGIIQRSFAWSSIQILGEQWSRTLSLILLRLEQELSSPPLLQAVQGICRPPVRTLLL